MKTISLQTKVELLEMEVGALRSALEVSSLRSIKWGEDKDCYEQFLKAKTIRELLNQIEENKECEHKNIQYIDQSYKLPDIKICRDCGIRLDKVEKSIGNLEQFVSEYKRQNPSQRQIALERMKSIDDEKMNYEESTDKKTKNGEKL